MSLSQAMQLPRETITPLWWRIAEQIAQGKTNKDIAHDLCLSECTIRNCCSFIYERLGIRGRNNRVELVLWVIEKQQKGEQRCETGSSGKASS